MNIGRNDPCPCNSGKKYKKCCLLKEYEQEQQELQECQKWMDQDLLIGQENLREYENKLDLVRAV